MDVYLDASVIVALLTNDVFTGRARRFLETADLTLFVSDYAGAEVASVIARRVRTGDLTEAEARTSFETFDHWVVHFARMVETTPDDIAHATRFIRRLDLTLRAPDAVNIAIAWRLEVALATFDTRMISCAQTLGVVIAAT